MGSMVPNRQVIWRRRGRLGRLLWPENMQSKRRRPCLILFEPRKVGLTTALPLGARPWREGGGEVIAPVLLHRGLG